MTDIYTQENGSKKKFLAPVLVILLCMVSLTAAGYAYSATVDNTDDPIVVEGITMSLQTSGGDNVLTPMFTINDIHKATHVYNGRAINAVNNDGFSSADGNPYKGYGTGEGQSTTMTDFAPGYYVEVLKGETSANGAHNPDLSTVANFIANATEENGVYIYDTYYKLEVNNATTAAADLKMAASWQASPAPALAGVKAFVVIKENSTIVAVSEVGAAQETFDDLITVGEHHYTVHAYVAITDYFAPFNAIPADFGTQLFNVSFIAANA